MDVHRFVCPDQRTREGIEDLQCKLCDKVAVPPMTCPDEHIFCKACIESHLAANPFCPQGGEELSIRDLSKSGLAERITARLTITCKNSSSSGNTHLVGAIRKRLRYPLGCRWVGKVCDLAKHEASCSFRSIECAACGRKDIPRVGKQAHLQLCAERITACELCEKKMPIRKLDEHLKKCPLATVYCPNHCLLSPDRTTDVTLLRRKDVASHLKECPRQLVDCEFRDMGCSFRGYRNDMSKHMEKAMQAHLAALRTHLVDVRRELERKQDRSSNETPRGRSPPGDKDLVEVKAEPLKSGWDPNAVYS